MVRCFVAVYPIKSERVYELQKNISKCVEGKEVEKENMHITLSFLGEKTENEIREIKLRLNELSKKFNRREVRLTKVKFIPDLNFPRVIAIEVVGLNDLSEAIKKEIGGDVKPPHLTLFRVKRVTDRKKLIEFSKAEINDVIYVDSIRLMKSTLTWNGPIYEVIDTFELI